MIKSALGSAAGAAAGAIGNSIFSDLASWWASAYKAILDAFSSSFLHAGEVSLGDYLHSPLVAVEVGVGMVLAAAGVIWAGARTGWTRSGEPVARALTGLVKAVVGTALFGTVAIALLAVADQLTQEIMTATSGSVSTFANRLGAYATMQGVGSTGLVFLFSLVGVLVTALLWVEMLIRAAGLIVVTVTAPIGAGGLVLETTSHWWRRLCSAELALIVIKPVIALVLGIGFEAFAAGQGIEGALVGLMILAAAAFAWPTVARLFAFFSAEVASVGLAGALGLAGGAAAVAASGPWAQGQPYWKTIENVGARASSPIESALGGIGSGGVEVDPEYRNGGGPSGSSPASAGMSLASAVTGAGSSGATRSGAPDGSGSSAGVSGGASALGASSVAGAGLSVAKWAAEAPGRAMGHAGDLAGVNGSPRGSELLEPPAAPPTRLAPPPGPGPVELWPGPSEPPVEPPKEES
ncbi:conjugal transfer protein TrbL family protein [Aciditerrimonas ferrireducens]|uniref:Conjugal transfer protein TrbL family protein n=1 Tax=Aciditerrimonas ferrireducens TaxID=667306 RepID=A0ABV6BZU4_9ACTN